ncbi:hypothetical protein POM88_029342 [Heracleum sosnowskyi]|uniref:Uncharacterized protein n=1 Tax=Heracleum sosnowskyi TaxID=360622 RepID=A0AAD8HTG7_9APIA|nr:hypothetical protein POM88_029342 [Heracleum sosnowskyi]
MELGFDYFHQAPGRTDKECNSFDDKFLRKDLETLSQFLNYAIEHAKPEKLEKYINSFGGSRGRLLKKLSVKKKKQLEELGNTKKVDASVEAQKREDTNSVDDLVSFIDGGDGDSKKGLPLEDEFDDGEYDPAWKEKVDREVEDFARRLNVPYRSRESKLVPHSTDGNSLTDP